MFEACCFAQKNTLHLALEDHNAYRYLASTPVVLAQLDGIVHDLCRNKSFFEKGLQKTKHLQANESIVGDESGLASLAEVLSEKRSRTYEGPISIPYRHGILHGRDLGYGNRRASTKAFVALISLSPWIDKVESGKQFEKVPIDYIDAKNATWDDLKDQWRQILRMAQKLRKQKETESM